MSVFYDNNITDVGRMLIAETQTGNAKFKPTKIVIGSGFMPTGKTSRTMTAVAEPVVELELNKGMKTPDGSAVFGSAFTNKDITQPFYYRELALYAKAVYDDGTEGEETLYSYGNAGDNAELIPAYSANTVVERQLDLLVYIGNDTDVSLNITSGLYVDANTFNETIYEMNVKITKMEENITPDGIGAVSIGTDRIAIPENADLNEYLSIGGYKCPLNATAMSLTNSPVEIAFIMDIVAITGEWETIDPNEHSYIMQRIYTVEGGEYFRSVHTDGAGNTIFEEWNKVITSLGGTVKEDFFFGGGYGHVGASEEISVLSHNASNEEQDGDATYLAVSHPTDLPSKLTLVVVKDGTPIPYGIFGEHNPPTAEQVKAIGRGTISPPAVTYDDDGVTNHDINTVKTTGFYRIIPENTNTPVTAQNGHLLMVIPWDVNTVTQIYIEVGSATRMYIRSHTGGAWGSWDGFMTSDTTRRLTIGTTDLTAGTSPLANDCIHLVYE